MKDIDAKLNTLKGININGNVYLQLNLKIDKFIDDLSKDGYKNVCGLYIDINPEESYINLKNKKTSKELNQLIITPGQYWIKENSSEVFKVNINDRIMNCIQKNFLGADIQVNWVISGFGFIKQNKVYTFIGTISISNIYRTDSFISADQFSQNVWNELTGGNLYLAEISLKNSQIFDNLPSENYKNWKDNIKTASERMKKLLYDIQKADTLNSFVSIADDFKGTMEVLNNNIGKKWDNKNQNNDVCKNLPELLFNKIFSGCGANDASKCMGEGISKIIDGLWKISNQIGHTTTKKNDKQYTYKGDKNTDTTFIYIAALLLSYIENNI